MYLIMAKIFIAMVLLHLLDDFWLQPTLLNKLKQKTYWDGYRESRYRNDWIAGLICHAVEWSSMIMLPWLFVECNEWLLVGLWIMNAVIHGVVDHLKCNVGVISLNLDQIIHLVQIVISFVLMINL